jgi:hypothetical protein
VSSLSWERLVRREQTQRGRHPAAAIHRLNALLPDPTMHESHHTIAHQRHVAPPSRGTTVSAADGQR